MKKIKAKEIKEDLILIGIFILVISLMLLLVIKLSYRVYAPDLTRRCDLAVKLGIYKDFKTCAKTENRK